MEVNFRFSGYKCIYYAGSTFHRHAVCFSSGFGKSYRGYVNCSYLLYKKQNGLNKTFFTSNELLDVITILSKELGFTLMSINENDVYFRVQIRMINSKRWNLFVSTFIRYLFEFPASLSTYCAYKSYNKYKNIRFTTLVQFYLDTAIYIDQVHSISRRGVIIKDISPKVLFNCQIDQFNFISSAFKIVNEKHYDYSDLYNTFELDNLPKIVKVITSKIDDSYKEYEKNICSWK